MYLRGESYHLNKVWKRLHIASLAPSSLAQVTLAQHGRQPLGRLSSPLVLADSFLSLGILSVFYMHMELK